jgi:type VI secretion system protein ImpF
MSEARTTPRVRLPLLDRLLDADPDSPRDPPVSQSLAIEQLRLAVRRDLEALLNARRRRLPLPPGLAELPVSPVGYGIPDPTAGSFSEEELRAALAREIQATIARFEPRLTNVKVQLRKDEREAVDRVLRLRIEAILRTDPVPEHISFETLVRPTTLDVAVREG